MISGIDSTSSLQMMIQTQMQAQKPQGPPKFEDMDTNGDGGIDKTEFASAHENAPKVDEMSSLDDEIFAILDSDGDGLITQEEMETNEDKVREFIDSKMGQPPSPPPMMTMTDSSEDTEDSLLLQLLEAYSQSDLANPLNAESTIDLLQ